MAKIQEYTASVSPNTESNFRAVDTSPAESIGQFAGTVEKIGSYVKEKTVALQKTQADLAAATNAATQEAFIANLKEPFDPDPESGDIETVMKPMDDANAKIRESLGSDEAKQHFDKITADHRARYVQLALSKNSTLQTQKLEQTFKGTYNAMAASVEANPGILSIKLQDLRGMRENLVKIAGRGGEGKVDALLDSYALKLNQDAAKAAIYKDPYNTDLSKFDVGDKTAEYEELKDRRIKSIEHDKEIAAAREKKAQKEFQADNMTKVISAVYRGQATSSDIDAMEMNGQISAKQAITSKRILVKQATGKLKESPAQVIEAERRLQLDPSDPDAITDFDQLADKYGETIGSNSMDRLASTYLAKDADPSDQKEFRKLSTYVRQRSIAGSNLPFGDNEGQKRYSDNMNAVHEAYLAGKKAGIPSSEMFNPTSDKYLGKVIQVPTREQVNAERIRARNELMSLPVQKKLEGVAQPTATPAPKFSPEKQAVLDQLINSLPKPKGK